MLECTLDSVNRALLLSGGGSRHLRIQGHRGMPVTRMKPPVRIVETSEARPAGYWPEDVWLLAAWQSNLPAKNRRTDPDVHAVRELKGQEKGNVPTQKTG